MEVIDCSLKGSFGTYTIGTNLNSKPRVKVEHVKNNIVTLSVYIDILTNEEVTVNLGVVYIEIANDKVMELDKAKSNSHIFSMWGERYDDDFFSTIVIGLLEENENYLRDPISKFIDNVKSKEDLPSMFNTEIIH